MRNQNIPIEANEFKPSLSLTPEDCVLDVTGAKQFLSEVLTDLPQNCFFDKQVCGCNGTHLALTNDIPYIIVVPFVEIIRSKNFQPWCNKVYPVSAGTDEYKEWIKDKPSTLRKAIKSNVKKFLVTYASLARLTKESGKKTKEFQLLIDEAHRLTDADDKNYIHKAIRQILELYPRYKSVCFMTSTPYERACFPEEIMHLLLYRAKWRPLTPVKLVSQRISSLFHTHTAHIALEHIQNKREGDPFFFYNSVEGIGNVVKKLLKANVCSVQDIRIIASKRSLADENPEYTDLKNYSLHETYLKRYIHKDLKIETVKDCSQTPKRINFLTATAFEGCDIYQETGVTYICADGNRINTRLEIHTKNSPNH